MLAWIDQRRRAAVAKRADAESYLDALSA